MSKPRVCNATHCTPAFAPSTGKRSSLDTQWTGTNPPILKAFVRCQSGTILALERLLYSFGVYSACGMLFSSCVHLVLTRLPLTLSPQTTVNSQRCATHTLKDQHDFNASYSLNLMFDVSATHGVFDCVSHTCCVLEWRR